MLEDKDGRGGTRYDVAVTSTVTPREGAGGDQYAAAVVFGVKPLHEGRGR